MTTDKESAAATRRSQRIRDIQSSQSVVHDDEIDKSGYEDEEEEVESEEDDDVNDPDARPGSSSHPVKRKAKRRVPRGSNKRQKKAGQVAAKKTHFNELREEFEESHLFQALNDPEVSVAEIAADWVEQYNNDKDSGKKDLVNFILNAVGCFTKIEEHDVNNNESASETVGEIETFFKRQKIHEFYLLSKKPEYKHLKKNYLSFINDIIITSDEKGILYENVFLEEDEEALDDDADNSNLMEDLLVWLSAFSVSSVRALRYISSLSLFLIESTLCKIIKKNNTSLENFKRQLENEQKKKQTAAIKKRIEQIEKNVAAFNNQALILENFIQDIVNTAFIHRFKDTDHLIRTEAMISLGDWMEHYPEFFFRVTFLKYLGWVLSDANSSVRLQVIKTLVRLMKNHSVVTGLRQFLERFKERIIEISFYDIDHNVRISAFSLLTEVNKAGFLEDEEINKVLSLIFEKFDKKLSLQLSNFIQVVEKEKTNETVHSLEANIEALKESFPYDLKTILKISTLIKILNDASQVESTSPLPLEKSKLEASNLTLFAKTLFNSTQYSDLGELLIQYFLLDISSIKEMDDATKKAIELSNEEEFILLELIHGYLLYLNEKDDEISNKSRINETETNNESLIQKVISYLPNILNKIESNEIKFSMFIKIFQSFKVHLFESSSSEADIFKSVHSTFLKYFKNNSIENLKEEYVQLFKNLTNLTNSTMISEVNLLFQNLTSELILEFNNFLKNSEFDIMHPDYDEIYQDYVLKLLLLGLNYNIIELLDNFKTIKDTLLMLLVDIDINKDSKFPFVFQLLVSATSWKLNLLLISNEIYDLEQELNYLPDLIGFFTDVLVDEKEHFQRSIKAKISSLFIDLFILLFNFFNNYAESGKDNISNLNRFKEIDLNSLTLSDALVKSFQYIFLSKEAILANVLKIELERNEDEDVNLNSLTPEDETYADEDEIKWELEKNLIIYTKKLLSLKKLGLINDDFVGRITLNVDVLGDLFKAIVEEDLEESTEEEDDDIDEIVQSQPIERDIERQPSQLDEIQDPSQPDGEPHSDDDDVIPDIPMED